MKPKIKTNQQAPVPAQPSPRSGAADCYLAVYSEMRGHQALCRRLADTATEESDRVACRVSAVVWMRAANLLDSAIRASRPDNNKGEGQP